MTDDKLTQQYKELVSTYIEKRDERSLYEVAGFARACLAQELGPEILVEMHSSVLSELVEGRDTEVRELVARANQVLLEGMMTYGLVYQELIERKSGEYKTLEAYTKKIEKQAEQLKMVYHELEITNTGTVALYKELKETQEQLVRSERLAVLGQFSGSISHELRNPLGVIDSSAYYLKTRLKDTDGKVHEHLDRIKGSVGSATTIIESLLNLTRMKEPQLARLDLTTITSDAIATAKVPAKVNVIRNFPEQEVLTNADHEQLRMAFQNIIKNAVEAMDNKGTLTVTVRSTPDKQAELSFADTGPGIAPENLEKVFQPLFSTRAKGIGFGLSIVKMIIDKHGGTIEAKSEPGKGAVIIIRLPLPAGEDKEV